MFTVQTYLTEHFIIPQNKEDNMHYLLDVEE